MSLTSKKITLGWLILRIVPIDHSVLDYGCTTRCDRYYACKYLFVQSSFDAIRSNPFRAVLILIEFNLIRNLVRKVVIWLYYFDRVLSLLKILKNPPVHFEDTYVLVFQTWSGCIEILTVVDWLEWNGLNVAPHPKIHWVDISLNLLDLTLVTT